MVTNDDQIPLGGRGHKFTNGSLIIIFWDKATQDQVIVLLLSLPFLIEFSDLIILTGQAGRR